MNARSVFIRAWREPRVTMMIILLGLIPLRPGKAGQVDITIGGVLSGGWDSIGLFYQGAEAKNLAGKPFTLVFTFDDTKGYKPNTGCNSGMNGGGQGSPGVGVLTMGSGSFTFGGETWESGLYRACNGTMLAMSANKRKQSYLGDSSMISLRIVPLNSAKPLPTGPDWKAPMSTTDVDNQSSCFFIMGPQTKEVRGCFDVKRVEVSVGKPAR